MGFVFVFFFLRFRICFFGFLSHVVFVFGALFVLLWGGVPRLQKREGQDGRWPRIADGKCLYGSSRDICRVKYPQCF